MKSTTTSQSTDMDEYFAGRRLYGDDFTGDELLAWFRDERSAYFEMEAADRATY